MNGTVGYLVAFGVATLLSLLLTPAALRFALRHGVLDRPTGHKAHREATPYLGGVAISLSFLAAVGVAALIDPPGPRSGELATVVIVAAALTITGLVDDLRGTPIAIRLLVEVGGALAIVAWGEAVQLTHNTAVDATLTVLWIVGVVNAFNLLDHHDGVSVGVAIVAAGWYFALAAMEGQHLVAALSIGLVGCALGFARLNFPPAHIFMGDAGSLFLGFLLAVIGLKLSFPDNDRSVTFLTPILVVGVVLFDMVLVVVSRVLSRRSPLQGGRDHTSHRLAAIGLPPRSVAVAVYLGAIAMGWIGLIVSRSDRSVAYLLAAMVVFVHLVVGLVLLAVPVPGARLPRRLIALRRRLGWTVADERAQPASD